MSQIVGGADSEGILGPARERGFLGRLPAELAGPIISRGLLANHPSGSRSLASAGPAVVIRGLVRYYMASPDGRQITIRYIGVGDVVGAVVSAASGLSTGFQIVEPSALLHLDAAHLWASAKKHPELGLALVEELTGRLRHAYAALAAGTFASVRSRVARDLVERARATGRLHPGVHLRVTQQELAEATGSVREVVSRSLRELRQRGLVTTTHSSVAILDPAALVCEAGLVNGGLSDVA